MRSTGNQAARGRARRGWLALGAACALSAMPAAAQTEPASSQTPEAPATNPTPATTLQRVEITGSGLSSADERRYSTASKLVYGRDEIDRMGDNTVGEILKRLPGVTISGRPGRGGAPRLRGLGNGYTQILIDGERMPRGFSLDSIEPDQIERIEIIRAPTAETGARAIAGTINIVMREDFRKKQNDIRLSLGSERARPRAIASWTYADKADQLDYTLTATARHSEDADESVIRTLGVDAAGTPTLDQSLQTRSHTTHDGGFVSSRLRWRADRDRFELQPYLGASQARTTGSLQLQQTVGDPAAPYATGNFVADNRNALGRLNGSWLHFTEGGARLLLRFGGSLAQSDANTATQLFGTTGALTHLQTDSLTQRDTSFTQSGKYSALLGDAHNLVTGWELQANQRTDRHTTFDNGQQELAEFGDNVQAATRRSAAYVQDEWEASPQLAFNAGLRWEGIATSSDSALLSVRNASSIWTPLLHMVWKLPDSPRDQLRLSLTRSYRTPTTAQLIARPTLSSQYPAEGANQPTSPDRAGNPQLRPEIARGLDLALEHYLAEGGIVSGNVYVRRIENLIRNVRTLQDVSWSPVQRWVSQPQNIGGALAAGLELEAKFRAADLWETTLPLTVRSNASLMWSRVDQVPGPDNRLDQQPRYTLNMGFDYAARSLPMTVGANLNFTPSFTVRQLDAQIYEQGAKRVLDAYAVWRFGPQAQLRLSLSNAAPRDYDSATTVLLDDGGSQRKDTLARTYMVTALRLELRF
jgi:iron complex outermembrane receptor protein